MSEAYTGDFVLLNPLPALRDEDGEYHCPAPVLNRWYKDEDSDEFVVGRALCGEVLRVKWTLFCPIPNHEDAEHTIDAKSASEWADGSSWELACVNGHVLFTSAEAEYREDPMPFDSRQVFGG